MTRITAFGRKRTYHEAKFNSMFDGGGEETVQPEEEQPKKKKKRKREVSESHGQKEPSVTSAEDVQKKGWGRSEEIKANAAASETRRQRRIQERMMSTICFACRERGHAAKDCPTNPSSSKRSQTGMGICYRCGSSQHTLSKCRKPADKANSLPFASCFVCKGNGHLASACPQNDKGVYPNGGCCKLCSKTDHLARNCPLRSKAAQPAEGILFNAATTDLGADEDDFIAFKRKANQVTLEEGAQHKIKPTHTVGSLPKRKIVVF